MCVYVCVCVFCVSYYSNLRLISDYFEYSYAAIRVLINFHTYESQFDKFGRLIEVLKNFSHNGNYFADKNQIFTLFLSLVSSRLAVL